MDLDALYAQNIFLQFSGREHDTTYETCRALNLFANECHVRINLIQERRENTYLRARVPSKKERTEIKEPLGAGKIIDHRAERGRDYEHVSVTASAQIGNSLSGL